MISIKNGFLSFLVLQLIINSFLLEADSRYRKNLQSEEYKIEKLLQQDNLEGFKISRPKLSKSFLRHAANLQAHKIVRFVIDNRLFDINQDPATLTWFALWRPQLFNDLVRKLNPSKITVSHALHLLENNFFGEGLKKTEYDQAKKLLLSIGAESFDPYAVDPYAGMSYQELKYAYDRD